MASKNGTYWREGFFSLDSKGMIEIILDVSLDFNFHENYVYGKQN